MNRRVVVEVTIPVYNEEAVLVKQINKLVNHLAKHDEIMWRIVIADNGSTDKTGEIARDMSKADSRISLREIKAKGRGYALRDSWLNSKSDVVCYIDVDFSTDLNDLTELIGMVAMDRSDIAYGSRLSRDSKTTRSVFREVLSRGYNLLVKMILGVRFKDAQCGFKALSLSAAHDLVPDVRDNKWFFDTELLYLAEKRGYRLGEVPVTWVEGRESKVRILRTVLDYFINLVKLRVRGFDKACR